MLQFSAAGRQVGVAAAATSSSPIPPLQNFRGVTLLVAQLPVAHAVAKQEKKHMLFGEEWGSAGARITLDQERPAQLVIAFYPDAQMSWTGVPAESPTVNLPHHLLQVRLPILVDGQKMYQSSYALTDEDRAMMIHRLGSGIPAKLANFSFEHGGVSTEPQSFTATRRGLRVLEATQILDAGAVDAHEVGHLFQDPDMNWWTPMTNYIPVRSRTMKFEHRITKANITSARKIQTSLAVQHSDYDPLYWLFEDLTPLSAYWIEADLEVSTTSVHLIRPPAPALGVMPEFKINALRIGGLPSEGASFSPEEMKGQCNNAATFWVHMKLNPEKVEAALLPGMSLDSDVGILFLQRCFPFTVPVLGDMPLPLIFEELWVAVPVRSHNFSYMFPLVLLLNDDVGQMGGQDYGGLPKKLANVTLETSPEVPFGTAAGYGTRVSWSVSRHGRSIANFTGRVTDETTRPIPGLNDNAGDEGARWALLIGHQWPRSPNFDSPMYLFPRSVETTKAQRAMTDMTIEFGTSLQEPLCDWFQGSPLEGGFVLLERDWMPSITNVQDELRQVPGDEYVAWWKRNFQLLYM